ncbi:MAG: YciI family protein [Hyphomicrobiales bacterium]|nr:MAG: YciI family protein [Hyphomicrobiales bacterium]
MQYMLLIIDDETQMNSEAAVADPVMSSEFAAYIDAMVKAGVYVNGARLRPTSASTQVRVRDQKAVVLAGPYAEAQEQLGGYCIIDVADLDSAIAWAGKCPSARSGTIEIRPVWTAREQ